MKVNARIFRIGQTQSWRSIVHTWSNKTNLNIVMTDLWIRKITQGILLNINYLTNTPIIKHTNQSIIIDIVLYSINPSAAHVMNAADADNKDKSTLRDSSFELTNILYERLGLLKYLVSNKYNKNVILNVHEIDNYVINSDILCNYVDYLMTKDERYKFNQNKEMLIINRVFMDLKRENKRNRIGNRNINS